MNLKILIYCTKRGLILRDYRGKAIFDRFVLSPTDRPFTSDDRQPVLNGKILAECDFEVEEIYCDTTDNGVGKDYHYYLENCDVFYMESGMTAFDLLRYFGYKNGGEKVGYAIHLKNLHIFEKPKSLSLFSHTQEEYNPITKAPQNMCYAFDSECRKYVVISIQPKWVMLILNGLKTIEVRRKVLKEML